GMLAMVSAMSLWSFRFAPSIVSPTGTPAPSVRRLRLVPSLARSVGFGPVFFPAQRGFGSSHRPSPANPTGCPWHRRRQAGLGAKTREIPPPRAILEIACTLTSTSRFLLRPASSIGNRSGARREWLPLHCDRASAAGDTPRGATVAEAAIAPFLPKVHPTTSRCHFLRIDPRPYKQARSTRAQLFD